ncbi:MAG: hypothetical protein ACLS4S_03450 [Bacteroides nordii]
MKRIFLAIMIVLTCIYGFAQENRDFLKTDTLLMQIQEDIEFLKYKYGNEQQNKEYRLYPTQNMWNFLELNTATGQIYQVQFSTNSNERFYVTINSENLNFFDRKYVGSDTGRFELYPTQNTYTFLMLDKKLGHVWQVQWGLKSKDRFITRIK